MGETTTTSESTQDGNKPTTETTSDGGDEFKPITSQDELNKALAERIKRERAKFSDYADLQAKAQKLDEFEAKAQADLEAANEATAAAEQRAADAELDALRWRVAVKHGISAEDVEMFLSGTDEDSLTRQAERLVARETDRKLQGNFVPNEGTSSGALKTTADEFAAAVSQALP